MFLNDKNKARQIVASVWLLCSFVILSMSVYGQELTGKISGKVQDGSGYALPQANIILEGTTFGAASNDDGTFEIHPVPPGVYTLHSLLLWWDMR